MKKAACALAGFSLTVCLCVPAGAVWDADYGEKMIECALNGERERGLLYQRLRNAKIDALELDAPYIAYDDLVLLAQVIHTEAGSAWLPDEWRMAVGEVVLNRVASPEFPDTLEEVVFQPGQYSAADRDWFEVLIPFRPCLEAALRLLGGERVIGDPSVVFQSGGLQGGVALELYDSVYGSTYFCYTNHPELYQAPEAPGAQKQKTRSGDRVFCALHQYMSSMTLSGGRVSSSGFLR